MANSRGFEITPKPQQSGVLLMHLLDRCNLRCLHCYMSAAPERSRVLPAELAIRTLGEAERLGIRTVYLTGGEPLLHPALAEILSAAARPRAFHLAVCTNGILAGGVEADLLKAASASAQVSIDGDEPHHDRLRASCGSFRGAANGIRALVSAGVSVTVVTTVCRDNLQCLPWLAEWALGMGVERISIQPLRAFGRAAGIRRLKLDQSQLCELFLQLSDLGNRYRERGLAFSLDYRAANYLRAHPCAAYVCNGAQCHRLVSKEIKTVVVRENGTVLPEIPTLDPRFALGSLYESSLVEIIQRFLGESDDRFHRLCRTVFMEVMPHYRAPIVPWDEIVSRRSWSFDRPPVPAALQSTRRPYPPAGPVAGVSSDEEPLPRSIRNGSSNRS